MTVRVPLWLPLNTAFAAASAALLSISFPPHRTPFTAWLGFIPIFFILRQKGTLRTLPFIAVAGIAFHAVTMGWTARFHPLAVPFIAVVYGLFFFSVPLFLTGFVIRRSPALAVIAAPAFWVAFELLRTSWSLKFPFGVLGTTQYHWPRLIQFADLTGVWGVSFLIVLVNAVAFRLCELVVAHRGNRNQRSAIGAALVLVIVMASVFFYGTQKIRAGTASRPGGLDVVLVQTLSEKVRPGSETFDTLDEREYALRQLETYLRLARRYRPDLIVFPENALQTFVSVDPELRDERSIAALNTLSRDARDSETSILIGTLETARNETRVLRYNAAYLFDRRGDLAGVYRKRERVPFGEYYPFGPFFSNLREELETRSGALFLDAGTNDSLLKVAGADGESYRFGVLICFESTLGSPARDYARGGADFLVNITDDLWSHSRAAVEQHAVFSVFRAIENRLPVLRAANGGVTAFITSTGHFRTSIPAFVPGVLASHVPLELNRNRTIYTRYGDWFAWLCVATTAALLAWIAARSTPLSSGGTPRRASASPP